MSTGMFTVTAADTEVEEAVELSTQERWNKAVREIRKTGVAIKQNIRECCNGCITLDQIGAKTDSQPWAYTYGGQGFATKWQNVYTMVPASTPRDVRGVPVKEVYFKHGNGSAQVVADTFRANGFVVVWDGNDSKAVTVKVNND